MGFFINEITYELKQHLNLSEKAWDVIYGDMNSFYGEKSNHSFSGFLNRIFYNFYQGAEGSIKIRGAELKENLINLSKKHKDVFPNSNTTDKTISLLVSEYEKDLLEKSTSYSKGIGKKFRVNKQNLEVLRESDSSFLYKDSIGAYMKAVFEEYATLPAATRESIFFKDTIDVCNLAIAKRNKLKIALEQRLSSKTNETYTRVFYISPYTIASDKNGFYNYLIGISEELLKDGSVGEKRISSFRISRIEKISVMSSMSGFLSHQKIDEIEKEIQIKTPQYMAGDMTDVTVSFTEKGLELFDRQLYLRPTSYEKIDRNTFIFHCTELQAIHYFFKFGKNARIQAPQHLRNKFAQFYREALRAYEEDL